MRSTIPAAAEIGDDLAVGSTAIGQGKVLATPLEFAAVAGAIGERGDAPQPTLRKGDDPQPRRATSPAIAKAIGRYMRAVVTSGTGVGAAIPGVKVAGKTGTAELRDTTNEDPDPTDPDDAAAGRRHDRHERVVRRLRAGAQAEGRRRGDARRPGRGRRDRPAPGGADGASRPRSTATRALERPRRRCR